MNFLPLLLVLNFGVLGIGYLLGSLAGLFILMGICVLAIVAVIVLTAPAQVGKKPKPMRRTFDVDTSFLATLSK